MCEILRFAVPALFAFPAIVLWWFMLRPAVRYTRAYLRTARAVWPDQPSLPQLWRIGHGDAALFAANPELAGLRRRAVRHRVVGILIWFGGIAAIALAGTTVIRPLCL